ncbi:probable leucine-rich repeat receptor-like protein kinase At1g68400 [Ricinus communis]|uniref:Serine-threonine protein kinase, plant-type, putative n=1 Tax=Ricinus communis TaxID=3988 RepID=B9RRR5_RICCO|nr:probable leucine-rich repeat receptor-like protein kinase At1g68400 [Ricinus communis]EEF45775.1 serine-threonine protein kinase, plant-type, putative [Ricinus communis]|eukprot:XP_002516434.1 probable leucine-rich repeat receptor-like protein kinase At1g68400 [Ricinus communis]
MLPIKQNLSFFFYFIVFLLFISGSSSSSNCDLAALLSFKKSLSEPSITLSSWINTSNPCLDSWYGVTCNPTTHRVTRLVLENLNLTGSITPLTKLTQLRLLSLKHNNLSSFSSLNLAAWPSMKHLYLSYNRLSGPFPSAISSLKRLHRLDLSYNHLSGHIPISEISSLPLLLTLRLEDNSFDGSIDSVHMLSLSVLEFNVSNNRLSGKIPAWSSRFPASSFAGNGELCGEPLPRECWNQSVHSQPVQSGKDGLTTVKKVNNWVVVMIVGVDTAAIVVAIVTIACCCYYRRRRRRNNRTYGEVIKRKGGSHHPEIGAYYYGGGGVRDGEEMVVFEGCKGFTDVDDLLKSSAELLGKGSVGTTYKVEMDSGDTVVVKRVRERRRRRSEVGGWLRMIGGLRHTNIVSLRAYYNSKDELLLVHDFLPNGSLHSLLHGNRGPGRTPLEWSTRLQLASGSAKGLAFFHGYHKAKLFHGNLTSSNILVDSWGNACISDIGIHQLLHSPPLSNDAYKAPELMPNNNNIIIHGKFTQRCDVYSFGVILLEILTGKMPTGEGETSLGRWVQKVPREEWTWEVFDFELLRSKEMEEEMVALMQVALLCLATLPRDRPKMSMVHRMIEDIRTKGSARGSASSSILNDISSDSSPSLSENTINFTSSS